MRSNDVANGGANDGAYCGTDCYSDRRSDDSIDRYSDPGANHTSLQRRHAPLLEK